MTLRVVFLDRASIVANIRRPRAATEYSEYPSSQGHELLERLQGATVAITNTVPLRAALLRQLPDLKLIAVAATGYDVVDVGYCREHGVAVTNIRNYAVHTVPEHAFALILAQRNLVGDGDGRAREPLHDLVSVAARVLDEIGRRVWTPDVGRNRCAIEEYHP